jgi:hypothetical protein
VGHKIGGCEAAQTNSNTFLIKLGLPITTSRKSWAAAGIRGTLIAWRNLFELKMKSIPPPVAVQNARLKLRPPQWMTTTFFPRSLLKKPQMLMMTTSLKSLVTRNLIHRQALRLRIPTRIFKRSLTMRCASMIIIIGTY